MEYLGRCKHGLVGMDGCPTCDEVSYMQVLYATVIDDLFDGIAWDDLTDEEQEQVENEVERRQRRG